jgi:hypothetical protein
LNWEKSPRPSPAGKLGMGPVFQRVTLAFMVGAALWVTSVAIRIEVQNAAAGYYLPRRDGEAGKWRMSRESTPRDQLRGLVSTVGLSQYFFAPLLMALAAIHATGHNAPWRRWLALSSGVVGVIALGLAFYRGYFSSLGL